MRTTSTSCPFCGAPMVSEPGSAAVLCGSTLLVSAIKRTEVCQYIETLRRVAEDMDTALMGIDSGLLLGGVHTSPPLELGRRAREQYEQFGEFMLPDRRPSCECGGDENFKCHEYDQEGPQQCAAGDLRLRMEAMT